MDAIVEKFVLHWGEMGSRWGVNRSVAQIHGLLFLTERPLTADEICTELNIARSNVSNSLKELQSWGLVQRVHVLGDRRDHFTALKDVQQTFKAVVEGRKRREIDPTLSVLRDLANEAHEQPQTHRHVRDQIDSTLAFVDRLSDWYEDMRKLPDDVLPKLLAMGSKILRLLPLLK
jgi:DNA-binding transcriptional regulator GbsR (MarR family)